MDEKINIELTSEELDEILEYQKVLGTDTVQNSIMNAIRNAIDDNH